MKNFLKVMSVLFTMVFMFLPGLTASAQRQPGIGEVVINEFVAAPKTTQNSEWVELYNLTTETLDIGGMYIDDIKNGGGSPKPIPYGTFIEPHGFYVLCFNSFLNNGGDDVRLLGRDQSTVFDAYTYTSASYDKSWCRMPDGESWSPVEWEPTPGSFNSQPAGQGTWTPGNLEIHVLNVGQGQSQLIIGPTGKTLLFDCAELNWNSNATATWVASEVRRITGGSHLNYVVASHWHLDHLGYAGYGGVWSLLEEQGITADTLIDRDGGVWVDMNHDGVADPDTEVVWHNAGTYSGTARRWVCYATDPRTKAGRIRQIALLGSTDQIDLGRTDGVSAKIVQVDGADVLMEDGRPLPGDHTTDLYPPSENDYCITLWINWEKFDFVSGGDTDGEYALSSWGYTYNDVETVVADRINQPVEVLAVNHHGSSHSSNHHYVTTLNPQVATYSVGSNSYGHPDQRVIDEFYAIEAAQYLAAMGDESRNYRDAVIVNGNIEIKVTDGVNYSVNGRSFVAEDPGMPPSAVPPQVGEVVVNEFLPAPKSLYTSEFVEIYNLTGKRLDLSGMYIDDVANGGGAPKTIPSGTIIEPYGFYVMDGFNNYLNNSGDDVRLLGTDMTTVYDTRSYSGSVYDKSYGRVPDGGNWSATTLAPTPGYSNN